MIPTNPLHILFLDLALLATLYFALMYFWVIPDAGTRGLKTSDYAIIGLMLIFLLNILGVLIWILIYNHDRGKSPTLNRETAVGQSLRLR